MAKNCAVCGKEMKNPELTHCSENCLFESVKSSKSIGVFPNEKIWKIENFEPVYVENPPNSFQNEEN